MKRPDEHGDDASTAGVSRRRFLRDSAAGAVVGSLVGAGVGASPSVDARPVAPQAADAEIFATPETVETRNGMPYRLFGKTGEKVSILGVGGYHVGVPSADEATRIIRTAIDEGVNFMDNAWEYHRGRSEVRMGIALQGGYRDKVFLMTKVCGRDRDRAMKDLEESLKRLKTDVIDLWQFHECNYDNDPDLIFAKNGAVQAAIKAKEQGKIRFIGFTGHKSPHIHRKMLEQKFAWDALQMPLNVCDAHYRSFARQVLPVALERKIAVVGMKSQGGDGSIPRKTTATVEDCLNYCFSLNIPICLSGMKTIDEVKQNIGIAKRFKPLTAPDREAILAKVKAIAGDGRLERFKSTQSFDSDVHQEQHGFG